MIYIISGIIVLLLLYVLIVHNTLVKLNNQVKEAFATMDVYLKKRWDLIPNIVETVKAHASHEKETLERIAALRANSYESLSQDDKIETNEKLGSGISKLMLSVEGYPVLKTDQSFLELSNRLTEAEDDIASSRKYFNAVVRNFNNRVEMFPGNLIASLFGYKAKRMFESTADERTNVRVEL